MNMYEQYIKERENLSVIKTDKGFACYRIEFPNCVLNDCFVLPEFRKDGHATFLINELFELCKGAGVDTVYCQTDSNTNGYEISQKALNNFGFEHIASKENLNIFKMEICKWENLSRIQ